MGDIFTDENNQYQIDCTDAIWASEDINSQYHIANCHLSDVDWVIETSDKIYLVEYKNANIKDAVNPNAFNPKDDKKIKNVADKFYDSLHYLSLNGKEKPKEYIYILEYPLGDKVSRGMIRNKIAEILPFKLQKNIGNGNKLIEKVGVLSIDEWNEDENYGRFPLKPV